VITTESVVVTGKGNVNIGIVNENVIVREIGTGRDIVNEDESSHFF
jgi:hypothetical protein